MKTLIQIGTNVGSDDFQSRCNKLTEFSKIILIEPHEKLNESIKRNYFDLLDKHEIIIVNKAIVPNEEIKEVELYYIENKEGFSSLINRKSFLLNQKKIVESISLNSLLDSMNLKEVSELHIDAEGLDYEILLSLDLVKYNIELITCEIWPYSKDDSNDNYLTGPEIISQVFEKYENYVISETDIGGMRSYIFEKNIINKPH